MTERRKPKIIASTKEEFEKIENFLLSFSDDLIRQIDSVEWSLAGYKCNFNFDNKVLLPNGVYKIAMFDKVFHAYFKGGFFVIPNLNVEEYIFE